MTGSHPPGRRPGRVSGHAPAYGPRRPDPRRHPRGPSRQPAKTRQPVAGRPAAGGGPDSLGPLLIRLRRDRGWSQPRLADRLCAAAGVSTVSRNEVSRWERELRMPGPFWLGWLATVLDTPLDRLVTARAVSSLDRATAGVPSGRCARAATVVS